MFYFFIKHIQLLLYEVGVVSINVLFWYANVPEKRRFFFQLSQKLILVVVVRYVFQEFYCTRLR